jgi:hypothetical protein
MPDYEMFDLAASSSSPSIALTQAKIANSLCKNNVWAALGAIKVRTIPVPAAIDLYFPMRYNEIELGQTSTSGIAVHLFHLDGCSGHSSNAVR